MSQPKPLPPHTPRRCARRLVVHILVALTSTGSAWAADEGGRLYRDGRLNIEFRLPAGWQSRGCSAGDDVACLELRPGERRRAPDPAVTIEVRNQQLQDAIAGHGLFERRGDAWVRQGRVGESVATAITGAGWQGIEASASCGISDEATGFHAAAGTCRTAIVSDGLRSAIIETDGLESTLDAASVITRSFRFLPRPAPARPAAAR